MKLILRPFAFSKYSVARAMIAATAALITTVSGAQPQFAQGPIYIAQTASFTGNAALSLIERTAGAKLVIDDQNAKGGIRGQKIELVSMDDGFEPSRVATNTEALIQKYNPIAMFLPNGTPTFEAMLPVIKKHAVPLIGPSTGALITRVPVQPLVFNVRASYRGETRKIVQQLSTMGITRIGVVSVDDSFGRDGLDGARLGFQDVSLKPVFLLTFPRNATTYPDTVKAVISSTAQAVLLVASSNPTLGIIKELDKAGSKQIVAAISTNAANSFVDGVNKLGMKDRIVIVSQIYPKERDTGIPMVRKITRLHEAAKKVTHKPQTGPNGMVIDFIAKSPSVSPAMLEGAACAEVLIAGLLRSNGVPSREKLVTALNEGGPIDIGWPGYDINYSKDNHMGIEFVDLSMVSQTGKFIR